MNEEEFQSANVTSIGARLRAAMSAFASPARPTPPSGEVSFAEPFTLFGKPTPYNPNELISTRGYTTIDRMRRDDQIKAALAMKKNSVIATGWQICAPEGMPDDWEPKVEVERCLWQIEGGFHRAVRGVLSALDYGFSFSEKVWHEKDGRIRLKKIATRRPHDLDLVTDPGGNLIEVRQNSRTLIPLDKFVLYTYDYEFSNPYGTPDLEAAYRAWWTKTNAYRWMGMLLEKMGIPPVFALYNGSVYQKADRAKLLNVLKSMQAATVAVIPRPEKDALELWSPEIAGQVSTVFKPAMDMFNQDIARALLMPGLLGMTADQQQGSLARAAVHFDVFMLVLDAIRTETAELINQQIVDEILLYNFGEMAEEDKPYFEWMPLTAEAKDAILAQWAAMVGAKVVELQDSDEAHVRELLKFPEMDKDDVAERSERRSEMAPQFDPADPGAPAETDDDEGEGEGEGEESDSEDAAKKAQQKHPTLRRYLTPKQFKEMMERFTA